MNLERKDCEVFRIQEDVLRAEGLQYFLRSLNPSCYSGATPKLSASIFSTKISIQKFKDFYFLGVNVRVLYAIYKIAKESAFPIIITCMPILINNYLNVGNLIDCKLVS